MSHTRRLHVPDGIYYVHLSMVACQQTTACSDDKALQQKVLRMALRSTRSKLHAFRWTDSDVRLVLQIAEVPVGRVVQLITGAYSRELQQRTNRPGLLFKRQHAVLLANTDYVLGAVRYVHGESESAGADDGLLSCSHAAYLGIAVCSCLTKKYVTDRVHQRYGQDRNAYQTFMAEVGNPSHPEQLEGAAACLPLSVRHRHRNGLEAQCIASPNGTRQLELIMKIVSRRLGISREQLLSESQTYPVTRARALIAWHATRNGVATIDDVAQHLLREGPALRADVQRYSQKWPGLFNLSIAELAGKNVEQKLSNVSLLETGRASDNTGVEHGERAQRHRVQRDSRERCE
jgi:hypothetical protein